MKPFPTLNLTLALLLPFSALSEEIKSEFLTQDGKASATVSLDPEKKQIDVHVNDHKQEGLPKTIDITLKNDKGETLHLELSAIPTSGLGDYRTFLPSMQRSYFAVELRIPFGKTKKKPKILLPAKAKPAPLPRVSPAPTGT